jgi:predicted DCC family thiol-disulfide oxidoreductase YuxK
MTTQTAITPACTVWYDGACPVCSAEIATYRKLAPSGEVAFVNVADAAAPVPAHLDRQALLARFTVTTADGTTLDGARGFIALWQATPRLRLIGRIAAVPPLPQVLELGYRLFLKVRPLWRKPAA